MSTDPIDDLIDAISPLRADSRIVQPWKESAKALVADFICALRAENVRLHRVISFKDDTIVMYQKDLATAEARPQPLSNIPDGPLIDPQTGEHYGPEDIPGTPQYIAAEASASGLSKTETPLRQNGEQAEGKTP